MFAVRLKNIMPRSLYARAALILLIPILTIVTVVSVVFIQRLYDEVTRQMTKGVVIDLSFVLSQIESRPDRFDALAAELAGPLGFQVSLGNGPESARREFIDLTGRIVTETLKAELPAIQTVDLMSRRGRVWLGVQTAAGNTEIEFSRRRVSARNPHQFLVLIGLTAFLMTVVAFLYLRGQMRPIKRLASAAEAFGKGQSVQYKPSGALEVRAAGGAFLDMRTRIERQIEQRTTMLSGVSHDLRTPLTRMKLTLSLMEPSEETDDLSRDVEDMEQMLASFLNYARSDAVEEAEHASPLRIAEDAAARARRGGFTVSFDSDADIAEAPLRPHALGRALDNLLNNAGRYGSSMRLTLTQSARATRFVIEDDGPGIPESKIETALKPFQKLDEARNQDGGSGVGLGLAIAADVARTHGGILRLGRSQSMGGLQAEMILPRAGNFKIGTSDV